MLIPGQKQPRPDLSSELIVSQAAHDHQKSLRQLNFLTLPFTADATERRGGDFNVGRPWARLDFGAHSLCEGWWKLDCEPASADLEVRVSSPSDPLILLLGSQTHEVRIYLRESASYDISLCISPWPGKYAFKVVRLRRLSAIQQARLLVDGARALLARDRPFQRIASAGRRWVAGGAIGIRSGHPVSSKLTPIPRARDSREPSYRIDMRDGVSAVIEKDDSLHPEAFKIVAQEFASDPRLKVIYTDVIESGGIIPRPQWDDELAKYCSYVGAPIFVRDHLVGPIEPMTYLKEIIGKEGASVVRRIALPLAKRTSAFRYRLEAPPVPRIASMPTVSAIIPTKYRVDLLQRCLEGLARRTDYPEIEVVIVDNGCTDPRLREILTIAAEDLRITTVVDAGSFNFSRLMNFGASIAKGEVLLFLNDDVEPLGPGWLHRMVESAIAAGVGAVGARLVYEDGAVQHAGVAMGLGGVCGHLWKNLSSEDANHNPYVVCPGMRTAVTGACMAVRQSAFAGVGGMDEAFPVVYGDIDLCLRLARKGLRTIYRGDAVLIHHESRSTGIGGSRIERTRRDTESRRIFLERWKVETIDDPFASPSFDPYTETGAVRSSLLNW